MILFDLGRSIRVVSLILRCLMILLISRPILAADVSLQAVEHCAAARDRSAEVIQFSTVTEDGKSIPIRGLLMKPTGDGPFPAVVLLHRSFGLVAPNCLSDAQKRFVAWGYVALVVDSDSSPDPNRKQFYTIGGYSFEEQAQDAHMAFHYLAARTGVDAARIAIVGYAWGGSSALTAVSSASVSQFIRPGRFRAVAAWHPACRGKFASWEAPVLVLIGAQDRLNSTAACRDMQARSDPESGLKLHIIAGAGHNFDAFWERNFDRSATDGAYGVLRAFLGSHLRSRLK